MWGKVDGVSPTPDPVVISVNHSMSCLIVKLKAGTGWKEDDIKDAEVTLCGLRTSSLINLADGTVTADGGATEMKPMKVGTGIFKALVVPQKVSDSDLVQVKVGTNSYSLKTSIDLKSGSTRARLLSTAPARASTSASVLGRLTTSTTEDRLNKPMPKNAIDRFQS